VICVAGSFRLRKVNAENNRQRYEPNKKDPFAFRMRDQSSQCHLDNDTEQQAKKTDCHKTVVSSFIWRKESIYWHMKQSGDFHLR
jgi:hypothetical protein